MIMMLILETHTSDLIEVNYETLLLIHLLKSLSLFSYGRKKCTVEI